ncbi:DUF1624 domain-containing protein [Paraflavitalea pollutisoli]|uniref:DUF1624 domain-containing protein n=1 Tax=Paraflavitalea pollutisoli TaxID=3034143 RepID=UPI0023EB4A22|nr:heparan-alpha-glucosaminide N-acetyltransferase domain-containing protein [Paraflavitalea sp. H1-2-19X]
MKRIYTIDVMRGIVMVIMTLDHVRDLLHTTSMDFQPTDLTKTDPALFFTRWVTHLCAPTFVFLSGVSAFLSLQRSTDKAAARRFLAKRGLWLIVIDLTLVNFGIWFDVHFQVFIFNVVAAIGFGLVMLALLAGFQVRTIAIIGLSIVFLHNLSPLVPFGEASVFTQVLMPFFAPQAFPLPGDRVFIVGYAPIPWTGVLLVGYAVGKVFGWEAGRQRRFFGQAGVGAIGLFLVLRLINVYGDGAPWAVQKSSLFTFFSFINLTKYPPSLQFCLLFLGILCLLLAALQGASRPWMERVAVYGKVPLFYFIVHFYLIHLLLFVMVWAQGFGPADMVFGSNFGRPKSGSGLPLWAIYLVWVGVVIVLYPLCTWYGAYKEKNKGKAWLRYL